MSTWAELDLTQTVVGILGDVHLNNAEGHHFGPPFVTAYHQAIELEVRHPDKVAQIGKPIGGVGSGEQSIAQYLSGQLSRLIRDDADFPIEGAFLSNEHMVDMVYRRSGGTELHSSPARASISRCTACGRTSPRSEGVVAHDLRVGETVEVRRGSITVTWTDIGSVKIRGTRFGYEDIPPACCGVYRIRLNLNGGRLPPT